MLAGGSARARLRISPRSVPEPSPVFGGPGVASLRSAAVSDFLRSYLMVGIFTGVVAALVLGLLGLSRLIQPRRPTPQKLMNYESGVDPVGGGWSQSQIRYYVFADRKSVV